MLPNDDTIKQFGKLLPAEAEWQEAILQEEADNAEDSYYDEEEEVSEPDSD